jgi:aryl-alcohol dehydrogenase-like predicted oxidoreductase
MQCVRHLAINTDIPEVIEAALRIGVFEAFMVEYNILRKFRRQLLLDLSKVGGGIIVITPTGRSLFRRSLRPTNIKELWELARAVRFHRDDFLAARNYDFLNDIAGITAAQAAIAFVLSEPNVTSAIFTTTSLDHLALNVAASEIQLEPEIISRIRALPDGRGNGPATPIAFAKAVLSMLVG